MSYFDGVGPLGMAAWDRAVAEAKAAAKADREEIDDMSDFLGRGFLYNGVFPLNFLRGDESVARGSDGNAIVVRDDGTTTLVRPGHWLVRDGDVLTAVHPEHLAALKPEPALSPDHREADHGA